MHDGFLFVLVYQRLINISGGMQYAVKFQIEHLGDGGIRRGDVILSNHPRAGGSHLPDFTVITPVNRSTLELKHHGKIRKLTDSQKLRSH